MDSIAMVEGEMKEISEAEMLEANLHTNTSKSNFCSNAFTSCFWKKEVRTMKEKEKMKLFTNKAASYDKIM
jgi:polyribonucleotide nucleotidyltransferase